MLFFLSACQCPCAARCQREPAPTMLPSAFGLCPSGKYLSLVMQEGCPGVEHLGGVRHVTQPRLHACAGPLFMPC